MAATALDALDYTSEVINGTEFTGTLTDEYTYTSPTRASLNVYLTIAKIDQNGDDDFVITPDTYDPTTAATFTFAVTKDGYHRFKYAVIPDYDNAHDYALYDVVYLSSVVYQATANPSTGTSPPNASYWTVVPDPTDLLDLVGTTTEPGNLYYQLYERIIYPFSKVGFGDASEVAALECCSDCERGEDVKTFEMLNVLTKGMNSCDQRGKFLKGEKMARRAEELIAANA